MSRKALWIILAGLGAGACLLLCVAGVMVARLAGVFDFAAATDKLQQVGHAAPDFQVTGLSGERVALSDYAGQPVLLSFSATWCPDCQKEAPLLRDLQAIHPDVMVIAVDIQEPAETVAAYAQAHSLTYFVGLDEEGTLMEQYHIKAIPTLLFIDREGVIRSRLVGIDGTLAELEEHLEAIQERR